MTSIFNNKGSNSGISLILSGEIPVDEANEMLEKLCQNQLLIKQDIS